MEVAMELTEKLYEAEVKAFKSLAGYKFLMFGYHAAVWITLNQLDEVKRPNPFKKLVGFAKKEVGSQKLVARFPNAFLDEVKK